ncbi:MAG: hypothetical protein WAQ52_00950 [Terriglobales bacterium]
MPDSTSGPLVGRIVVNDGGKALVVHTLIGDVIIKQEIIQAAKRKTWRPLAVFSYPTQNLEHDLPTNYQAHLALQMHKIFKSKGYTQFTGIITIRTQNVSNLQVAVINLVTNQHAYVGAIHNAVKQLWDVNRDRVALQNALNTELKELYQDWTIDICLFSDARPVAYRFTYDPEAHRISILAHENTSAAPDDYPDRVSCTGELFPLLAAILRSEGFLVAGNLETVLHSYPLSKLFLELLDTHSCDANNVRVNVDDVEDWDYINPAADEAFNHPVEA